jgi:hypothetical protein
MAPQTARVTVLLPQDLLTQLRAYVYHTPGATLSGEVTQAVVRHLHRRQARQAAPPTNHALRLRRGRPLKLVAP